MLNRLAAVLVAVATVLGAAGMPAASADVTVLPERVEVAPEHSRIGGGGGWCWFSDSRSVFSAGRTYSSWIDNTGRIYVASYDHVTQRMQTVAIATRYAIDDHNNPSLLVHTDGRISAFWSGHNGPAIHVRTTARPHDLTTFGPRRDVPARIPGDQDVTYTNPIQVPTENDRIYLFWRSHHSHQAYSTSDDQGRTWSPAKVLIDQPGHRPYVKYAHSGGVIAAAFTNGHPRDIPTSIHYVELRQGSLYRADGSLVRRMGDGPMAPKHGDVIWDAKRTGVRAWVWDVAQDALGRPVVAFATIRSASDHRYHYARWDGSRWVVRDLARAGGSISDAREPHYSGGISLDHDDPSTLVMSRKSARGIYEIERWTTRDGGSTWSTTPLTVDSKAHNYRPVIARGAGARLTGGVSWLNGSYGHWASWRTTVVTSGRVPRMKDLRATASIGSSAPLVKRGDSVRISARLVDESKRPLAGREMTLLIRERGSTRWQRVLERRTDANGVVAFAPHVWDRVDFAIEWPGDYEHLRSPVRGVRVDVRR